MPECQTWTAKVIVLIIFVFAIVFDNAVVGPNENLGAFSVEPVKIWTARDGIKLVLILMVEMECEEKNM